MIGGNVQVESKGRRFRGRLYPWGVVEGKTHRHPVTIIMEILCSRVVRPDLVTTISKGQLKEIFCWTQGGTDCILVREGQRPQ